MEERQFGFRAEKETTDAIYILNYVINRKLSKDKGKSFAFFADFKAAFDRLDRAKLGDEGGKDRRENKKNF